MNKNSKKTILYIMSDVRSGSTLLENILSNSPNTISVGELHHLDSHLYKGRWGKTWNWNCSCGKSINECLFWSKVLNNLKNRGIEIENTEIRRLSKNLSDKEIKKIEELNLKVIRHINEIYGAIFDTTNANVIVDSSKVTEHGIMLYDNSHYQVKIIYLKRDIRAVTLSKAKWARKFKRNVENLNLYRSLYRTKKYDINLKNELKKIPKDDKISINYEDLAQQPQLIINQITEKFMLHPFNVPEYMDIEISHSIGGTPNRFEKSKIRYDSKWKDQSTKKPFFHVIGKLIDTI